MSFQNFCLKAIDDKNALDTIFIEKYMFIVKSNEKFPVPLDLLVSEEIYSRKDNAKIGLERAGFVLGSDYIKIDNDVTEKQSEGRPKTKIFLSVDCFKSLCIVANEKGRQIRAYYLILETMWKQYMEIQFLKIKKEKDELEENLEQEKIKHKQLKKIHQDSYGRRHFFKFNKTGPTLYIISQDDLVKFGICGYIKSEATILCSKCEENIDTQNSSDNIDHRLFTHRTLWPKLRVNFIAYTIHARLIEKCLKVTFRDQIFSRNGGEVPAGVKVEKVVEAAENMIKILSSSEKESSFLIEKNLYLYNDYVASQDPDKKATENINLQSIPESQDEKIELQDEKIEMPALSYVEINHIQINKEEFLDLQEKIKKYDVNQLRICLRRFKLSPQGCKTELIEKLKNAFDNASKEQNVTSVEIVKSEEMPVYDPENLPRGLSLIRVDNIVLGIKMVIWLKGQSFETSFRDSKVSMEEKYKAAWDMRQDIIQDFKKTGVINKEFYNRRQEMRAGICLKCGVQVSATSSMCQTCANATVKEKPERLVLLALIRTCGNNLSKVGREFNVTDTMVRKWLSAYGYTKEQINTRQFESIK